MLSLTIKTLGSARTATSSKDRQIGAYSIGHTVLENQEKEERGKPRKPLLLFEAFLTRKLCQCKYGFAIELSIIDIYGIK